MVADWPDRRFLDLVGATHPIVQAPMAGAGGVALAAAAMDGGALGSLPCGMLDAEEAAAQAAEVRALARGPINLNFFCHTMPEAVDDRPWRALLRPYYEEYGVSPGAGAPMRRPFDAAMASVVEAVRPEAVSFHFGLPDRALLARVKDSGAVVIGNATTVEEAHWLAARGVDAIIAQGWEAGGHRGWFLPGAEPLGLVALVPRVCGAVEVPVIAAGGIGDARGIAAALALGASAVQLGTAYLHCPECEISPAHRAALRTGETIVTNLFTGGLARGVPGRLTRELGPIRAEAPLYPLASAALAPIRQAAEAQGEFGFGPMWAGQAATLGEAIPAARLTRRLAAEALARLRGQA
ncbi:MAG: NAD(P)H-dependent flavin oxidoreductase [Allosphingosinicella sp.]